MKTIHNLFYLALIMFSVSCSEPSGRISSDFDHGSIGQMKEIKPDYFQGTTKHWQKRDSIGNQYYWFYFKVDQVKNKEITFELNELEGIYRRNPHIVYTGYTQPVYSYDQESWERIVNVKYDSASRTFWFTHQFSNEPAWIAYAHPYPYNRLVRFITSVRNNALVQVEELAKTREARPIELLTITDPATPDPGKKTIFLMAMQHPGEDAGSFLLEGLVNYLISDDEAAKTAREKFVYKVIIMMNPDGVFNGTTRYNMEMEDLNIIWLNEEKMQPEVQGVKDWVDAWYARGNKIDMFLDFHNHTQLYRYNVFIFMDNQFDSLVPSMNKYWPSRIWHMDFEGSSFTYFHQKGIPGSSVELSQSVAEEGNYLTIDDYHRYGEGVVRGFNDYFGITDH
jgi:hypothetical protein